MKSIEEAAKEYAENKEIDPPIFSAYNAFKFGVAFAQQWILLSEEFPKEKSSVLIRYNNTEYVSFIRYWIKEFNNSDTITHWRPIKLI
ncbi:MAG: hypothetical protein FWC10_03655 [Lentimicrobiaceae bacterium]|nr:hypothetical protein [Lentimicrobiaceae bacterium]